MSDLYRALDILTDQLAPKVDRRGPYWRPRPPKVYRDVVTPQFKWEAHIRPEPGTELVHVDTNAAFVAAITSADFAHGALERGDHSPRGTVGKAPGYYQISVPTFQSFGALPDPLGSQSLAGESLVWVAQPTVGLLLEVERAGYLSVEIHDAWTSTTKCSFRKWGERLRDDRAAVIDRLAAAGLTPEEMSKHPDYVRIKDGYAMAVQLFTGTRNDDTGEHEARKSSVLRPDWFHTVHAQNAASIWRRAYNGWRAGYSPLAIQSPDALTYTLPDWKDLTHPDRRIYPVDATGKGPGKYKVRDTTVELETTP